MPEEFKLIEMLSSNYPQVQLMALELINSGHETSDAVMNALKKAMHDENVEVAEKANQAYEIAVQHQAASSSGNSMPVAQEETRFPRMSALQPAQTSRPVVESSTNPMHRSYLDKGKLESQPEDYRLLGQVFKMRPKTHATWMQIMSVGYLPVLIVIFIAFVSKSSFTFDEMATAMLLTYAILGIYGLIYLIIRKVIPVGCDQPGCNGRMEKEYYRTSSTEATLRYKCKQCTTVYRKNIFVLPKGRGGFGGGGGR